MLFHTNYELIDIEKQITEAVGSGMPSKSGADCIAPNKILSFTKTNLYKRMHKAHKEGKLFREHKFLMGVPASKIENATSNETVVIQGIIDVCFIEDEKYVIADYKTDNVNTMDELKDMYHVQLECYQDALKQITKMDASELIIYSVKLDDEISFTKSN